MLGEELGELWDGNVTLVRAVHGLEVVVGRRLGAGAVGHDAARVLEDTEGRVAVARVRNALKLLDVLVEDVGVALVDEAVAGVRLGAGGRLLVEGNKLALALALLRDDADGGRRVERAGGTVAEDGADIVAPASGEEAEEMTTEDDDAVDKGPLLRADVLVVGKVVGVEEGGPKGWVCQLKLLACDGYSQSQGRP